MPTLNFEKLLCGLLVYSNTVEGVLYRSCKDLNIKKSYDYEKIKYTSVYDICEYINKILPDVYIYRKGVRLIFCSIFSR